MLYYVYIISHFVCTCTYIHLIDLEKLTEKKCTDKHRTNAHCLYNKQESFKQQPNLKK